MLLLHIIIALASLGMTAFAYVNPSARHIQVSVGLVGLTVASGTYLVLSMPAHLVEVCFMGLLFVGVSLVGIVAANRKLVTT